MRATTFGIIGSISLGLCIAAGDVACTNRTESSGGFTSQAPKPIVDGIPASAATKKALGIASWKAFLGRGQIVFTGYDEGGSAVQGYELAWFHDVPGAQAHMRVTMLDGSKAAVRIYSSTAYQGHITPGQQQVIFHVGYDLQQWGVTQGVTTKSAIVAPGGIGDGIRTLNALGEGLDPLHPEGWLGAIAYGVGGALVVAGTVVVGVIAAPEVAAVGAVGLTAYYAGVGAVALGTAAASAYATYTEIPSSTPSQAPPTAPQSPAGTVSMTGGTVTYDPNTGKMTCTDCTATMTMGPPPMTPNQVVQQDFNALPTDTCPSCANPNGALNVDPSTGQVTPSTTTDPSAPTDTTGSSGSSSGGTDNSSQDTASQDMGTQDQGATQDAASQDAASQDAASQDAASQDAASQDAASQDAASQDAASQDAASQDAASQDAASQDAASQDAASQDTAERHHAHKRTEAWRRIYNWLAQ